LLEKKRFAWLAVLLAFGLVAAACGDDDDSGDGGTAAEGGVPDCLTQEDLYAIFGAESGDLTTWEDAQTFADELGSTTTYPTGDLEIFGPGTESGTYDAFIELGLTALAEERGQEPTVGVSYTSSPDDNAIVSGIEGADSSLGWVGFAFAEGAGDEVREVQIAGEDGTCVSPDVDAIADGSYPLSRPLFIYVNQAKLESKPELAAFVDLYLNEGYGAVEDAGYVSLPEDLLAESKATFEDSGVEAGETSGLSGEIVVSGSSTVEPISNLVGEQFLEENGDVALSVDGPGTGDGFELFCSGDTDISDASRAIKDEEAQACADAGIEFLEIQIGLDGITVMTKG
jgi:ABC-type phosphate transport system substrate-binding protein